MFSGNKLNYWGGPALSDNTGIFC